VSHLLEYEPALENGHVRFADRDAVASALVRLGICHGTPVPAWPPRALPLPGASWVLVSPVREGWVSIWCGAPGLRNWFPSLSATLECAGVYLAALEECWAMDLYQDGVLLAECAVPPLVMEHALLDAEAEEVLEELEGEEEETPAPGELLNGHGEQGTGEPGGPGADLDAVRAQIAGSQEYREASEARRRARPTLEQLATLVPLPLAEAAWRVLREHDDYDPVTSTEEPPDPLEHLERFALALGIRDAAWSFEWDADEILDGAYDYEEGEGLPAGWPGFLLLPARALPVVP
jgi:hypothetical protein